MKVKSHVDAVALWTGLQPLWLFSGNECADILAGRGAALHAVPQKDVENVDKVRARARLVLRRVAVVTAHLAGLEDERRPKAKGASEPDDGDRARAQEAFDLGIRSTAHSLASVAPGCKVLRCRACNTYCMGAVSSKTRWLNSACKSIIVSVPHVATGLRGHGGEAS